MRSRITALAFGLLVVAGVWLWLRREPGVAAPSAEGTNTRAPSPAITPPAQPVPTTTSQSPDPLTAARQKLLQNPTSAKAELDALAKILASLPRAEAVKTLIAELQRKTDAATKLPFTIGAGGDLDTAPTFRVWMLDQLGRLDPSAAADYAKEILATPDNSDEWAVAMRNFARARTSPGDAAFLSGKLRELINNTRWQTEVSAGWLEAFDLAVHLRDTTLAPDLARLITRTETPDKPAAFAAFLTLDRLVLAEPTAMLARLQAEPALMQGRELTRANYFARADVRDPQQRTLVEAYLAAPQRTPEELTKFTGLYPNANRMISKNLLTPTDTPKHSELAAHDRAALTVLDDWIKDPRFEKLRPSLNETRRRVAEFVRQSEPTR